MCLTLVKVKEDSNAICSVRIQSNKGVEFRYVSTAQNPEDMASRGCTVKMLTGNEFWWHGPTWLQNYHDDCQHGMLTSFQRT